MSQVTQLAIIRQIEKTLQHLETFLPLANVHMVDYFSKNVYYDFFPKDIKTEAEKFGHKEAINAMFEQETGKLPYLHDYINTCHNLTLKNTSICLSLQHFKEKLKEIGSKEISNLNLDIFMKAKKSHEVEIVSEVAAAIKDISNTSHLIDIGDGKGYLSSMLALYYKIPVLGVDASEVNTCGAVKRATKLSRIWNGVVTNLPTRETSIDLYKQITKFVDEKIDFYELVSNVFLVAPGSMGLVGLHTCGNLSPTSLRIFNENKHITSICNVGCCYHHLSEEFEFKNGKQFFRNNMQNGFPMSQFLKSKKFTIRRGARMVAAQSVDRILNKKVRPKRALFYRALFEIIVNKTLKENSSYIKEKHVGKFRKEIPTFLEYTTKASKKINLPLTLSENEIMKIYTDYENRIDEIDFFYLVRCMLSPVVETLILLDRLLFLYENGHTNSFLVQFFDPIVSPRCYGIVALKK